MVISSIFPKKCDKYKYLKKQTYNDIFNSTDDDEYGDVLFRYTNRKSHNKLKFGDYCEIIRVDCTAIRYIPLKNEYLNNLALEQCPDNICNILTPTDDQIMFALACNVRNIECFANPTTKMKKYVLRRDPDTIKYIRNRTKSDYEYALRFQNKIWNYDEQEKYGLIVRVLNHDGTQIQNVKNKTAYLCLIAYLNNPRIKWDIPSKFKYVTNAIPKHMPKSDRSIYWTPKKIEHRVFRRKK